MHYIINIEYINSYNAVILEYLLININLTNKLYIIF